MGGGFVVATAGWVRRVVDRGVQQGKLILHATNLYADNIYDKAGTGAPSFPNGLVAESGIRIIYDLTGATTYVDLIVDSAGDLHIAPDGVKTLVLDSPVYIDEKGQLAGARLTSPSSRIIQDNTEGAYYYKDTTTLDDYIWTNLQLNHDRKLSAILSPHIHWEQEQAAFPNWLLQTRYQTQGALKTTAWTNTVLGEHVFDWSTGILNQISDFVDFTPSNDGVSDIVQVRIIRDTNNDSGLFAGADPVTGDVYITDFDIHKPIDTMGSRTEYSK